MSSILKVDQIQNAAGTTGLTIDSNGVVTKGSLPSFRLSLTAQQDITTTQAETIVWNETTTDNTFIQGGMSLNSSTGLITVPVSGVYSFSSLVRLDVVGSGYVITRLLRNSSDANNSEAYFLTQNFGSTYDSMTVATVFKMDANDTIEVTVSSQIDTNYHVDINSSFSGYLIG